MSETLGRVDLAAALTDARTAIVALRDAAVHPSGGWTVTITNGRPEWTPPRWID